MTERLLRKFSQENFDDTNYEPVLHVYLETARPLSLIYNQTKEINIETSPRKR